MSEENRSPTTARDEETATAPLKDLSDDALLARVLALSRHARVAEVDLLRHLGEVDARRLYAREACPSMYVYCTRVLHFSEAEAYLRITVARTARERPALLAMLADGRLHLSAIARLAPHLADADADAVLARAVHRSKREILELVAELAPRPEARAGIRALPERGGGRAGRSVAAERELPVSEAPVGSTAGEGCSDRAEALGSASARTNVKAVAPGAAPSASDGAAAVAVAGGGAAPVDASPGASARGPSGRAGAAPRAAVVEPLSPGRYRVQFTVDRGLRDKLERLGRLLGVTERDLARVIDAAVTEKLQRLESRRSAEATRPRQALEAADTRPRNRHVPAAVRRAVYRRDGGQCRFVDRRGRRCPARDGLELHHQRPFAMGGDHAVDNLRLMCGTHNRYIGEIDFGEAGPARRGRQAADESRREGGAATGPASRRVASALSGQS